jgi:spectinomycin phosphotransferase
MRGALSNPDEFMYHFCMLEPPDLSDSLIISRVEEEYGLRVARISFLPLGADANSAVYRVVDGVGEAFFLKLRKEGFDPVSVRVPQFLRAEGIRSIIAPLATQAGRLWGDLDPYRLILYPFIAGQDGYTVALNDAQWRWFGADLGRIHAARLPSELAALIPVETFSPRDRERVRGFQALVERETFADPVAGKVVEIMRTRRSVIEHMLNRGDLLAQALQARVLDFVLCHADLHAGNLHLTPQGDLYIVDWDAPMFAPKEHDLLLIGGARPWDGTHIRAMFYEGYSGGEDRASVDPMALAYYRYERIILDIGEFCSQLLATSAGGEDRERSFGYFASQFQRGCEIDVACATDNL